jgi:hypothetical protein
MIGSMVGVVGTLALSEVAVQSITHKTVDADGFREKVEKLIADIEGGYVIDEPNNNRAFLTVTTPNTGTLAPITAMIAYLQAAWYTAIASAMMNGDAALLTKAKAFLEEAKGSCNPDLRWCPEVAPEKIMAPLDQAASFAAGYGIRLMPVVSRLNMLSTVELIREQQSHAEATGSSAAIKKWAGETAGDIAFPFQVVAGLWTGKNPGFKNPYVWRAIQFGLYGVIGLTVYSYVTKPLKALTEAID